MAPVEKHATREIRGIHEVEPGVFSITSEPRPHGRFARMWHRLERTLIGPPLPSWRDRRERLSWTAALAILGADLIASSVYGPEEMLRTLAEAGMPVVATYAVPVAVALVGLLAILALSYWQTIAGYPDGAGGYIVASDNLGRLPGLVSAAALLIDYTLDIAVSVASGVETITSTVGFLAPWRMVLALGALALIMLANLRGIRAAAATLSAPIYFYLLGTGVVVAVGLVRWLTGTLPPYTPPASAKDFATHPAEVFGLLLLLRAFSSGAVALTGIEAVSNGVQYLKPPETSTAHQTLVGMAIAFGALFLGTSFLSSAIGIIPDPTEVETVHSQLTRTLLGSGPAHVALETSALLLLILAADTGFADFPRLLSLLARDGFLPAAFATRGPRLTFSNGIILVAVISGALIVIFRGSVSALVPLFTIGAFATFTLSQAGMTRHWWRRRERGWRWRLAANAVGALATSVVLAVVIVSKFAYGAWIVVVILPILVFALYAVGAHHERLVRHLQIGSVPLAKRIASTPIRHHIVLTVEQIDRVALHALAYCRALNVDLEAVHICEDRAQGQELRRQWDNLESGIPLTVLESPIREHTGALLRYLDFVHKYEHPHNFVTVVVPELLPTHWWHPVSRNYSASRVKWALLFRPQTAVTSVPYGIQE